MKDIIGYTRSVPDPDNQGKEKVVMFMRGTSRFEAGSRFKYTPDFIDLSYKNLVEAIGTALDKQMEEDGKELFTEQRENVHIDTTTKLDYDELMKEFTDIIANIPGSTDMNGETEEGKMFHDYWAPRITEIVTRYLGMGKKVSQCTRAQVEQLSLIVDDLKDLITKK